MKRINVLEVIQQGEIGGGESHLLTLLHNLDREKFYPVVIALSDGEMMGRLDKMGIKNYVVKSRMPFNVFVWSDIRKILIGNKINIIHTHGARALSNVYRPAEKLSIPVVHTVHGWSFHDYLPSWKRRLRIAGERFLTKKAKMNIVVSESNREIGMKMFRDFRCKVINNGVDLTLFNRTFPGNIRKELGIPADSVVLTFVARFIHDKNPLPLIRAFSRLQQRFKNTYLLMVGDGPAKTEALELVQSLGITGNVLFPGYRSDIPLILNESDIFCLPSIKEGLPISLIEAMAMCNACIATDVQGCKDVITHERDGLLVKIENLENGLVEAFAEIIGNREKLQQFSLAARKTVEQRFDAVMMTRKIEDIYQGSI